MEAEPTDEELYAFVNVMLSNLDQHLRERHVIEEAVRDRRDLWVMLYRLSVNMDGPASPS